MPRVGLHQLFVTLRTGVPMVVGFVTWWNAAPHAARVAQEAAYESLRLDPTIWTGPLTPVGWLAHAWNTLGAYPTAWRMGAATADFIHQNWTLISTLGGAAFSYFVVGRFSSLFGENEPAKIEGESVKTIGDVVQDKILEDLKKEAANNIATDAVQDHKIGDLKEQQAALKQEVEALKGHLCKLGVAEACPIGMAPPQALTPLKDAKDKETKEAVIPAVVVKVEPEATVETKPSTRSSGWRFPRIVFTG